MRLPLDKPYTITNGFAVPDANALFKFHSGIDYAAPAGRSVHAPVSGKVVYAQLHPVRGNMVVIYDGKYYHRLMHNSRFATSEGEHVNEGEVVAYVGSTGLSSGPHCHYDINTRGVEAQAFTDFIDPMKLIGGRMDLQQELDLMRYKFTESQKALKVREDLTDLLQWKLSESEKAIRAREQQAEELLARIAELEKSKGSAKYTPVTEQLYKLS